MSSASVPNPNEHGALPGPAPRPKIVRPSPPARRPRAYAWIVAALVVAAAAGAGLYWNRERVTAEKGGGPTATAIRTAVVSLGDLHRTVRLGGSIQAERFV